MNNNKATRLPCLGFTGLPAKVDIDYDYDYVFLFTTSSMLVPKSLSITMAAFRPGAPDTEPPGCVVAPV